LIAAIILSLCVIAIVTPFLYLNPDKPKRIATKAPRHKE